jgi:hypothetical protein
MPAEDELDDELAASKAAARTVGATRRLLAVSSVARLIMAPSALPPDQSDYLAVRLIAEVCVCAPCCLVIPELQKDPGCVCAVYAVCAGSGPLSSLSFLVVASWAVAFACLSWFQSNASTGVYWQHFLAARTTALPPILVAAD